MPIVVGIIVWGIIIAIMVLREVNKSKTSNAYAHSKASKYIGANNLDRFYIECVLSGNADLDTAEKVARAKILARNYALEYSDIKELVYRAKTTHDSLRPTVKRQLNVSEVNEYAKMLEYKDLGQSKMIRMYRDYIQTVKSQMDTKIGAISHIHHGPGMDLKPITKSSVPAALVGTAVGGPVVGYLASEKVKAENKAQWDAYYKKPEKELTDSDKQAISVISEGFYNLDTEKKKAEAICERLQNNCIRVNKSPAEIFNMLEIKAIMAESDISGAIRIRAEVRMVEQQYVLDNVPGLADGALTAFVPYDGVTYKAILVLPKEGVSYNHPAETYCVFQTRSTSTTPQDIKDKITFGFHNLCFFEDVVNKK